MAKRIEETPVVREIRQNLPDILDRSNLPVKNTTDVLEALDIVKAVRRQRETLEAEQKKMLDPIKSFFKEPIAKLKDAEAFCSASVSGFYLEQKKQADESRRNATESHSKPDTRRSAVVATRSVPKQIKSLTDDSRVQFQDDVEVEVTDLCSLLEHLLSKFDGNHPIWEAVSVNESKLKRYIKKTGAEFPGVEVEDKVVTKFFVGG